MPCFVPRLERLLRRKFPNDHNDKKLNILSNEFKKSLNNLPGGRIEQDYFKIKSTEHFFSDYNRYNREEIIKNPFPNRNTTAHGYAIYNHQKTSINMIVFIDWFFSMFTSISRPSKKFIYSGVKGR